MLMKNIIYIIVVLIFLFVPCVQVYAATDEVQDYLDEIWNNINNGEDSTTSETVGMSEASGQQVYDFYRAVKTESGIIAAVKAVSEIIEPILDEYAPLGLHKPVALAQLLMESRFLSSDLCRVGNNPYGIKGDGYIGTTKEYINGKEVTLSLSFQAYDSFEDGVRGYCRLMMKDRYLPVRQATSYVDAAKAIKDCGYASDPDYVGDGNISSGAIIGILDNIKAYELDQFVSTALDSRTREENVWYDIKRQSLLYFRSNLYLKPRGEEVQQRLQTLGLYDSVVDGWIGKKSEAAIIDFQKQNGLYVDGVAGIYTYEALFPENFTADIGFSDQNEESGGASTTTAYWSASVSSYLIPENSNNGPFTANMMTDGRVSTCWIPKDNRSGVGEYITLSLSNGEKASFNSIDIFAGYGKTDANYYTNYRIKSVSVYIDDVYIGDFELEDVRKKQSVSVGNEYSGSKIKIEIKDCYISQSYNGYKAWEDLCVSEIWIDGEITE